MDLIREYAKRHDLPIVHALDRLIHFALARLDGELPSDHLALEYSGHRAGWVCSFRAAGLALPDPELVASIDALLARNYIK